jgi:hypothetical protein
MASLGRAEVFLGKILNTRFQEEMKPELAAKLQEITIDPKSLTLTKKIQIAALKELPKPTSDLAAGNYTYDIVLEMNGQKIPMTMTRVVKEENGNWVVKDAVKSPMGEQSDEAVYTKWTLKPVSRKASAGPGQEASYAFDGNKVITTMMGKTNTETVDGAYLHDGGGNDMVLARLPLKEGYEAGIYIAGQDGKAKLNKVSVVGTETINGKPCFKCQVASVDDPNEIATYYIATDSRVAQRIIAPLSQVPGATITFDLKN